MAIELVYDDDCGVCSTSVAWLTKNAACVTPVAMHDEGLELDAVLVRVRGNDGSVRELTGAAAIAEVLCHADTPQLRAAGWAMKAPVLRTAASLGYKVVSPNRAWISARLGLTACRVPAAPAADTPVH